MATTLYIAPSGLEYQGSQCFVLACDGIVANARDSYRAYPHLWREAGVMNFQGKLVCLEGPPGAWEELKASEPLMAGTQWTFE